MRIRAQITGWRQVNLSVRELQRRVSRGGQRAALTKAARPMTSAARRGAPRGETGLLRKSIIQKAVTYTQSDRVAIIIGPTRRVEGTNAAGKRVRPANYAHLVEFGRGVVKAKDSRGLSDGRLFFGKEVAAGRAQPFIGPAYRSEKGGVERRYKELIAAETLRVARMLGQRTRI